MTLMGLLVLLVFVGLAFLVVRTLSAAFGIPAPITSVIYVLLVVVCVLYLLQSFGLTTAGPVLRLS